MSSSSKPPPPPRPSAELHRLLVGNLRDYAIVMLDPEGRVSSWNAGAEAVHGYRAEDVVGRHYRILYPEPGREARDAEAELELARKEDRIELEGWRVREDGTRFWAHVVVTALREDDALVGFGTVTRDMTPEREARRKLARRERQLEEAQVIAHLGSWEYDLETGRVDWSDELFRIFGLEPSASMDYETYLKLLHPKDRGEVMAKVGRARKREEPYVHEHRIRRPDGEVRWVQSRGTVIDGDGGRRLVGTTLDITDLKESEERARRLAAEQAAREEAERTAQRMGLLAEASALLGASRDYRETLQTVAWLAVPSFADWAVIDMEDPDGEVRRLAVAHLDDPQQQTLRDIQERYPQPREAAHGVRAVIRTGEPELFESVDPEILNEVAEDAEHRRLLDEIGLHSVLIVPIRLRERTLGAITFVHSESGRRYGQDDLLVAQELAARVGLAIENAHLHEAERDAREHAERAGDRIQRLQRITAELSEAVRSDAVARVMVEQGAAAFEADSGSLVLQHPGGSLEAVRTVGLPAEVVEHFDRFEADIGLPMAEAVRTNELVMVADSHQRDALFPAISEVPALMGMEAMVAVPLESGGGVLGSLGFGWREPRVFGRAEQELLRALGRQCAQALERAWLYENEHHAREAAEEASRARSQFVAMVSHELRTPLSAIIGYQELLSEGISGSVNERQREQLTRIRRAATHLRDLINQILSLSRIEAGREEVELRDADLGRLAGAVVELMQQMAAAKGLDLETRLPDEPARVHTDAAKVRQILLNLVSNAIKFTDHGRVVVGIRGQAEPEWLEIYVSDTGVGVPEADRDRIFEPFTQVDQSMTRSVGGSGLGLAVSRRLASLLGGRLELESRAGVGSTFTLHLPRLDPEVGSN